MIKLIEEINFKNRSSKQNISLCSFKLKQQQQVSSSIVKTLQAGEFKNECFPLHHEISQETLWGEVHISKFDELIGKKR